MHKHTHTHTVKEKKRVDSHMMRTSCVLFSDWLTILWIKKEKSFWFCSVWKLSSDFFFVCIKFPMQDYDEKSFSNHVPNKSKYPLTEMLVSLSFGQILLSIFCITFVSKEEEFFFKEINVNWIDYWLEDFFNRASQMPYPFLICFFMDF